MMYVVCGGNKDIRVSARENRAVKHSGVVGGVGDEGGGQTMILRDFVTNTPTNYIFPNSSKLERTISFI